MSALGWNERWCCYVCKRAGASDVHATVRIFSGIGASGFPACAEHVNHADTAALTPLNDPCIAPGYKVSAYVVEADEYGFPKLGRKMWEASPREGRGEEDAR